MGHIFYWHKLVYVHWLLWIKCINSQWKITRIYSIILHFWYFEQLMICTRRNNTVFETFLNIIEQINDYILATIRSILKIKSKQLYRYLLSNYYFYYGRVQISHSEFSFIMLVTIEFFLSRGLQCNYRYDTEDERIWGVDWG